MRRVKRKQVHIYTFLPIHYTFFAIVEAKDATAEGATWDEEGEAGKDRKVPLLCLRIYLKHTYLAANGSSIYEIHKKRRGGHSNLL